jgi:hypothetical protein
VNSNWVSPGAVVSGLIAPPTISSFFPLTGDVGATVTITGSSFNCTPDNNVVFFGATRATVSAATATSLTVTVPSGGTYAPISVLNIGTSLAVYSLQRFNPTYSPSKASITSNDFDAKVDFVAGGDPDGVVVGDVDGDGMSDLIVANRLDDNILVYLNTSKIGAIGSTSFAAPLNFDTGDLAKFVALGDLDGDGKADLVAVNEYAHTISVMRNTSTRGAVSFGTKVDFTTGSNPSSVAIGDIDGDGKLDLAVANISSTCFFFIMPAQLVV